MDWTESPLIAAYFAVRSGGFDDKFIATDAAIYGVPCPPVITDKDDPIKCSNDVVAYFAPHLTTRITNQRGLFTYHKRPDEAYAPAALVKWTIPSKVCMNLKVVLDKCGVHAASMFPDLGGIAEHVGWLVKWQLPKTVDVEPAATATAAASIQDIKAL